MYYEHASFPAFAAVARCSSRRPLTIINVCCAVAASILAVIGGLFGDILFLRKQEHTRSWRLSYTVGAVPVNGPTS